MRFINKYKVDLYIIIYVNWYYITEIWSGGKVLEFRVMYEDDVPVVLVQCIIVIVLCMYFHGA